MKRALGNVVRRVSRGPGPRGRPSSAGAPCGVSVVMPRSPAGSPDAVALSFPFCLGLSEEDPRDPPARGSHRVPSGSRCDRRRDPPVLCHHRPRRTAGCFPVGPRRREALPPSSLRPRRPPPWREQGAGWLPTAPPCARTPLPAEPSRGQRGNLFSLGRRLQVVPCVSASRSWGFGSRRQAPLPALTWQPGRPLGRVQPWLPTRLHTRRGSQCQGPPRRSCPHPLSEGPSGRRPPAPAKPRLRG